MNGQQAQKSFSTSLDMIYPQWDAISTSIRMANLHKSASAKCWEGVQHLEFSVIGGGIKWSNQFGELFDSSLQS